MVQYDFNKVYVGETKQDVFVKNKYLPNFPSDITLQPWQMNVQLIESSIKHLTFEEIDSFLKSILWKNKRSHAKFDFRIFSKCVNMADINGLWKNFKVRWPN